MKKLFIILIFLTLVIFSASNVTSGNDLSGKEWVGYYHQGEQVIFAKTANLSRSSEDWGQGFIIKTISAGTKAVIVAVDTEEYCPGMYTTRIKVKVNDIIGWVHPWDIKKIE